MSVKLVSRASVHEVGADYSAAVTAMAERMYDRICSRSDVRGVSKECRACLEGGKRLAKRQSQLLAQPLGH